MATIYPQATPIAGGVQVAWMGLSAGDVCIPWPQISAGGPFYATQQTTLDPPDAQSLTDRNAQIFGGTPGTVHIEGSNFMMATSVSGQFATTHLVDGTTACSLTTAQAIAQILEPTYYVRPNPTGGASGTNVLCKFVTGSRFL